MKRKTCRSAENQRNAIDICSKPVRIEVGRYNFPKKKSDCEPHCDILGSW